MQGYLLFLFVRRVSGYIALKQAGCGPSLSLRKTARYKTNLKTNTHRGDLCDLATLARTTKNARTAHIHSIGPWFIGDVWWYQSSYVWCLWTCIAKVYILDSMLARKVSSLWDDMKSERDWCQSLSVAGATLAPSASITLFIFICKLRMSVPSVPPSTASYKIDNPRRGLSVQPKSSLWGCINCSASIP